MQTIMQKTFGCIVVIITTVVGYAVQANAQEFLKNSIKIGAGIEIVENTKLEGVGFVTTLSYQRQLKEGLWLAPHAKHGTYTSWGITDTPDEYFNTTTLGIGLNATLLQVLYFGVGTEVNYSHGLIGTGGEYSRASHYVRSFYPDLYASAGLRIAPRKKRFAVNIIPFTFSIGIHEEVSYVLRLEAEIKW